MFKIYFTLQFYPILSYFPPKADPNRPTWGLEKAYENKFFKL
jgi:hypothetical protein